MKREAEASEIPSGILTRAEIDSGRDGGAFSVVSLGSLRDAPREEQTDGSAENRRARTPTDPRRSDRARPRPVTSTSGGRCGVQGRVITQVHHYSGAPRGRGIRAGVKRAAVTDPRPGAGGDSQPPRAGPLAVGNRVRVCDLPHPHTRAWGQQGGGPDPQESDNRQVEVRENHKCDSWNAYAMC